MLIFWNLQKLRLQVSSLLSKVVFLPDCPSDWSAVSVRVQLQAFADVLYRPGCLTEDDEYCGPIDLPCEQCSHLLFTLYDRAHDHRAQLEHVLAEPEKHGLSESAKLQIKDCCLGFYAGLDYVIGRK